MLPLYRQLSDHDHEITDSDSAHLGLLFDKYVDGWTDWGCSLGDETKGQFFKQITQTAARSAPCLKGRLDYAIAQHEKLIDHLKGKILDQKTHGRLISGLGSAHPYETGFIWHPTLAVPYLPGSGVKGVLRHWVEHWAEDGGPAEAHRLFGADQSADGENQASTGIVIVFDALPVKPPKLAVDILTPHYQAYYENPENNPPADYYSPIPVKFLTVAPDQPFLFSLALRPGVGTEQDLEQCRDYLFEVLQTLGAGGKTAVGYGLMKEDVDAARQRERIKEDEAAKKKQEEWVKKAEQAAMDSGLPNTLAEMIKQAEENNWREDNNKFYTGAEDWLPKIMQHDDASVRIHAANQLADYLEQGNNKGILENPDKTKGKKNNPVFKLRAIQIAKQIIDIRGNK